MFYYLINIPGSYGYTIPVKTQNIAPDSLNFEREIINAAIEKELFYDAKEGNYANVVEMSQYDFEHFSKPNMVIHNID